MTLNAWKAYRNKLRRQSPKHFWLPWLYDEKERCVDKVGTPALAYGAQQLLSVLTGEPHPDSIPSNAELTDLMLILSSYGFVDNRFLALVMRELTVRVETMAADEITGVFSALANLHRGPSKLRPLLPAEQQWGLELYIRLVHSLMIAFEWEDEPAVIPAIEDELCEATLSPTTASALAQIAMFEQGDCDLTVLRRWLGRCRKMEREPASRYEKTTLSDLKRLGATVETEVWIGCFRVDFLLNFRGTRIVVEVMGHPSHYLFDISNGDIQPAIRPHWSWDALRGEELLREAILRRQGFGTAFLTLSDLELANADRLAGLEHRLKNPFGHYGGKWLLSEQ